MTAFTFNTNITNAQRGIPTLTFTTAGTSGTSDLSAAKSFITLTDHRGVTRKYVITVAILDLKTLIKMALPLI